MQNPLPVTTLTAALAFALGASSCATRPAPIVRAPAPALYEWHDTPWDAAPGDPLRIVISLSAQRATYHRGDQTIGWSFVATGKEGNDTPPGDYTITEKIADKYSNRYGWIENEFGEVVDHDANPSDPVPPGCQYVAAPMPYWMRLTSYGIGMHAGIIPRPGDPASHGCIRLPKTLAPTVFDNVEVGTPVKINP